MGDSTPAKPAKGPKLPQITLRLNRSVTVTDASQPAGQRSYTIQAGVHVFYQVDNPFYPGQNKWLVLEGSFKGLAEEAWKVRMKDLTPDGKPVVEVYHPEKKEPAPVSVPSNATASAPQQPATPPVGSAETPPPAPEKPLASPPPEPPTIIEDDVVIPFADDDS